MILRWLLVLAAVILGIGCGDDGDGALPPERSPSSTTPASSSTTTQPAPPELLTTDRAGLSIDACPQPWLPLYAALTWYGGDRTGDATPPVEGPSINVRKRSYEAPDVDGDGVPDAAAQEGDEVVVSAAAGELRLARAGGSVGSPGGQIWLGDLDGDGHDEIVVYVTTLPAEGSLDPLVYDLVIVPGSTTPGTHDPADVGVRLPIGVSGPTLIPVGDHDGDGADDLATYNDAGGTDVLSGSAVLEPGPGERLPALPEPMRSLESPISGVLELVPGEPPVMVRVQGRGEANAVIELTLLTEPPVTLATDRLSSPDLGWSVYGPVDGFVSGTDRIVSFQHDGGRSGFSASWMWNLDSPCS